MSKFLDFCTSWNARRLMALVSHHGRNCGNSLQLVDLIPFGASLPRCRKADIVEKPKPKSSY
jgi:hypothetical protein